MHIELDDSQPIKLVQITDTHLEAEEGGTLVGMNTDMSLKAVIDLVKSERPHTDVLMATGDISNCGTISSYQRFLNSTKGLASYDFWLPGNHDVNKAMHSALAGGHQMDRTITVNGWELVILDTSIEAQVGGYLSDQELEFLDRQLENSKQRHVLVCMHHHPIPSGCNWLDTQQVTNSDRFFEIIDSYSHVRGIIWGHIHQVVDEERRGVRLMATPSTCVQFATNSYDFKLDKLSPGYRWLELYKDGSIESGVSRVALSDFDIAVDFGDSDGY